MPRESKKQNSSEPVIDLLERTKFHAIKALRKLGSKVKQISSKAIEELVLSQMREAAKGSKFEGKVARTAIHAFPDIMVGKNIGIEVKMTIGNKWTSTGNSILESTRIKDVKQVFLFFVKVGGDIGVKYRLYEECLNNIVVTHFPRYTIDMNLSAGKSIFDKMRVDYDYLRQSANPVRHIRDYYRKQLAEGEELWWMNQESSSDPVIKSFSNLTSSQQNKFIVDSMILFPEIFGSSNSKFARPAAYLFTEFNAVSSNIRDKFTAGGQAMVEIDGISARIPKILHKLLAKAKEIRKSINSSNKEKLAHYWRLDKVDSHPVAQWKKMLDSKASWKKSKIKASDIFDLGLNDKTI